MTFRKSILSIAGIYGVMFILVVVYLLGSVFILGRETVTMIGMMLATNNISSEIFSATSSQILAGIGFILLLLFYFVNFWTIIIFKNNAIIGKSLLKESFVETIWKTLKVILFSILFGIIFLVISGVIGIVFEMIMGKNAAFLLLLLIPFFVVLIPPMYTVFYGILCEDGPFFKVLSNSFSLGFSNWFRIIGYMLLFAFGMVFMIGIIFSAIAMLAKMVNSSVLLFMLYFIVQIITTLFASCFYTLFYLDLVGVNQREISEIDITEQGSPARN